MIAHADEGDLMAAAGVNCTIGREDQATYGESGAGRGELGHCGYGFKAPIDPYDADGKPLPLVYDGPLAPVGGTDAKVRGFTRDKC